MKRLPMLVFDWEKRLKNLYVSTSAIKNFIRLDWSKSSRVRKDKYNKRVDEVIAYAKDLNDDYNKMASFINTLSETYGADHTEVSKRLAEKLKDTNSIQSDLRRFSNEVRSIEGAMGKANKNFDRAGINIQNCTCKPLQGSPQYPRELKDYQKKIDDLWESLDECKKTIGHLEHQKNLDQISLDATNARKVSISRQLLAMQFEQNSYQQKASLDKELASISKSILLLERDIKSTEKKIFSELELKKSFEANLSSLDRQIVAFSNAIIGEKLRSLRVFVDESKKFIDDNSKQLQKLERKIDSAAKSGEILSEDELQQFTDKVNSFFKQINSLQKLTEAGDKDVDYGEGFFRTISTKEEKLEKLDKKLHEIKKGIRQNREQMQAYKEQIEKYKGYKGNAGNEAWIKNILIPVEGESKKFQEEIAEKERSFNEALSKVKIQAIKPYYSEPENLVYKVEEVSVVF